MQIDNRNGTNPLIILSRDEVLAWLRERADAAGFADRELSAVQIIVEYPPPSVKGCESTRNLHP